jgi:biotin transport system substrate-specific component
MEKQNKATIKTLVLSDNKLLVHIFWILTFSILTAIGAQFEIPAQPVPFTLQTFFVLLAGALLGIRGGFISMGLYLLLGMIGLPVFSGGAFGMMKILGPTGGYLLAFPVAAVVVGYLIKVRSEYWWSVVSMFVGSLIIFTLGTIQLNFVYFHNWATSFQVGFLLFSWWDLIKIVGAATISHYYFQKVRHLYN